MTTQQILERAKQAKRSLLLSTKQKNDALLAMADSLLRYEEEILRANAEDVAAARETISPVMIDRLALSHDRLVGMADGIRHVVTLDDPVGEILGDYTRKDGLNIRKIAVPMGVVAIIYESRPNVTSDAAALALKSGNVCVLRTGKEAHRSASAIVAAMREGLRAANVDENALNLIEDTSRESANALMTAVGYVDLLIPRGGKGLIEACVKNAKVPCIQTGTGICHAFIDETADQDKALSIVENGKTSRPSVCNAMEVCLVHEKIAPLFLPKLWERLQKKNVIFYADEKAFALLQGRENCFLAGENDFDTEFLDYKLAVKVVSSVDEAIAHIAKHSTGHSECIVTQDKENASRFTSLVDSAAVYVNASTRFTDGGEFGLGCEMGISTQKLHARGPMGLRELTTYKYVIVGDGHIR
ncbi:MAG: glutamate-5-semialdehyde dehydrogenase [Clostridia bacterium]|nr:glutamate-5-semialdehyde dehydrogenase [Clostridia bacterium]